MPSEKFEANYFSPHDLRIMKQALQTLQRGDGTPADDQILERAKIMVYAYRTGTPQSVIDETARLLVSH